MNLNKVLIAGRLTADPQLRTIGSGQSVATFSVATNRVWNDKAGVKQEQVEYHNVVVWGRQAEVASQFLNKGSLVLVEGRLQTRTWQSKEGHNMKTTEIIAERIQFGPRSAGGSGEASPHSANAGQANMSQGGYGARSGGGDSQKSDTQEAPSQELPTIDIDADSIKAEDLPF